MHYDCFGCDLKQVDKISKILEIPKDQKIELKKQVSNYLENCDMEKTNPEIMGEIWQIITEFLNCPNPYEAIKQDYNKSVLSLETKIDEMINQSTNPLKQAFKMAIIGNIIDFSAKHTFNKDIFLSMLDQSNEMVLKIDKLDELINKLLKADTLLYLGDNCGEIVLDKHVIKTIKKYNPKLTVYYGTRGYPIINDVTCKDASEVNMAEVAIVVSNGDGSLGTVLNKVSPEFLDVFNQVDLVVCKGQGNYESLYGCHKDNLYFLFMVKCDLIASMLKVPPMSLVCLTNQTK